MKPLLIPPLLPLLSRLLPDFLHDHKKSHKHGKEKERFVVRKAVDKFAMDLMTPPEPIDLESRGRSSTLDALLDFDNDPLLIWPDFKRQSSSRLSLELSEDTLAKPLPLHMGS